MRVCSFSEIWWLRFHARSSLPAVLSLSALGSCRVHAGSTQKPVEWNESRFQWLDSVWWWWYSGSVWRWSGPKSPGKLVQSSRIETTQVPLNSQTVASSVLSRVQSECANIFCNTGPVQNNNKKNISQSLTHCFLPHNREKCSMFVILQRLTEVNQFMCHKTNQTVIFVHKPLCSLHLREGRVKEELHIVKLKEK